MVLYMDLKPKSVPQKLGLTQAQMRTRPAWIGFTICNNARELWLRLARVASLSLQFSTWEPHQPYESETPINRPSWVSTPKKKRIRFSKISIQKQKKRAVKIFQNPKKAFSFSFFSPSFHCILYFTQLYKHLDSHHWKCWWGDSHQWQYCKHRREPGSDNTDIPHIHIQLYYYYYCYSPDTPDPLQTNRCSCIGWYPSQAGNNKDPWGRNDRERSCWDRRNGLERLAWSWCRSCRVSDGSAEGLAYRVVSVVGPTLRWSRPVDEWCKWGCDCFERQIWPIYLLILDSEPCVIFWFYLYLQKPVIINIGIATC